MMETTDSSLKNVIRAYETYDEDKRLEADNVRRLEFMTTLVYMNKYLKEGDKVLDVAAGGGAYALYYAARGLDVTALDITPSYVEIIRRKAREQNLSIESFQNDARDLSVFPDETFDTVFCMGPIYHLVEAADRRRALAESLRVLKRGGMLYVAYINKFFTFAHLATQNKQFLQEKWYQTIIEQGAMKSDDPDCFWTDAWFSKPSEMEAMLSEFPVRVCHHLAQDGTARMLAERINDLKPAYFNRWADYHIRTCEEPSILGSSNHGLIIARKHDW